MDENDSFIVVCELDIDKNNHPVERTDFYGFKLVQEMRMKGLKNRVLFVSFLPERYFRKKVLNATIMTFYGHGFLQLPFTLNECKKVIEKINIPDNLSLYDVQRHACGLKEIIEEKLHILRPTLKDKLTLTELEKKACKSLIIEVYNSLSKEYNKAIGELNTVNDGNAAYDTVRSILYRVLPVDSDDKNNPDKKIADWKYWKVLWLDDKESDESPLKKELEHRGIKVVMASSYDKAMKIWEDDRIVNQEFCLILSDYRLKNEDNSREKQGYHFIKFIAEENIGIGLMAYSGLTRRFLMESFKHYGIQLDINSKIDFPQINVTQLNYLADQIIYSGDEHWMLRNNQPQSEEWELLRPNYFKYKNSPEYYTHQLEISRIVMEQVKIFIEFFESDYNGQEQIWNFLFK
ncbi:MAG: hypothetical protein IPL20_03260 [Saprospiraceae bacterium]|nr:hypothetical protein [Saprospiraceae bacterium]